MVENRERVERLDVLVVGPNATVRVREESAPGIDGTTLTRAALTLATLPAARFAARTTAALSAPALAAARLRRTCLPAAARAR